jgi:HAAS domain-containing protein
MTGGDPIEEYLDQLYASLRTTPREGRRILAEAEDHLREGMAEGLAAGLSEGEAAEHAISSFGSVRAVTRAHSRGRGRQSRAALAGGLAAAAWKLAAAGLLAVGASGLLAAAMNALFGREFVGGTHSTARLSGAACHRYLALWPHAHSCAGAAMLEISSDAVVLRLLAGAAGLALLAGYLLARRWLPRALPRGFEPTVAVALFGTAAVVLAALSVLSTGPIPGALGGLGGPGSYASGAAAALAAAAAFAWPLRRALSRPGPVTSR